MELILFFLFCFPSFCCCCAGVCTKYVQMLFVVCSMHAYAWRLRMSVCFVYTNYPIREKTESLNDPSGLIHLRLHIFCAIYLYCFSSSVVSSFSMSSSPLSVVSTVREFLFFFFQTCSASAHSCRQRIHQWKVFTHRKITYK